jgi:predicted RNase H-like nuclease
MSWVAGVDGCRAGWVVVLSSHRMRVIQDHHVRLCASFAEVLSLSPTPTVMAIDIPIGLLDAPEPGGRECDRRARRLLGRRASSVFTPPTRAMLEATRYEQVRSHGVSIQAFNILPKIREVDRLMTPRLQTRIHEAHPELAFRSVTGAPMQYNKKIAAGHKERLQALSHVQGQSWRSISRQITNALRTYRRVQLVADDLLDASILAWIALRIANGQASRLPPDPSVDQKGLRMEIWH